ncbi:spermatogenesis-associated protein 22 [Electrophorus electricus]|uniref:spermatogenesis-associated protein 22 n=1 Tax=Electrophorus electricus TaxID=8005 RepID=UPI0015D06364|nr:spermatogenesis-associated protein 22 [Electrophorus electricus]
MRRNENQPRPTAGCLSVPLFNQKKRSRLPLTSNPSESGTCSGSLINVGHSQETANQVPLAQRNQWYQQANSQPHQDKAWPTTSSGSTGGGYAPIPHPHKPAYAWSQTGEHSMAITSSFWQGGFPNVCVSTEGQPRPFPGKQLVQQQLLSRQAHPPKGSLPSQQLVSAQSQASHWRFKSAAHTGGGQAGLWVEDTFGTSRSVSNAGQQEVTKKSVVSKAKPSSEKSLRILTAVIEGMRHWSQYKDKVPMLFEIFATLDSAVTIGKYGAKNFLMRDGKEAVQCVYYENDQPLPRLIRGQLHRCVGNYDRQKDVLTCMAVRAASVSEQRNAQQAVKVSDGEMRNVVQALTEM